MICQICKKEKNSKSFSVPFCSDFVNDICIECEKEIENSMIEKEKETFLKNSRVIEEAMKDMNEEERLALEDYLEETINDNFQITSKPVTNEKESFTEYPFDIYVNQTVNGGYIGDEYSGQISIFLKEDKFLTYDYSC